MRGDSAKMIFMWCRHQNVLNEKGNETNLTFATHGQLGFDSELD